MTTDALTTLPIGTRVRLSPAYLASLGADDHGVGIVTGPVPSTLAWDEHQAQHGPCVMVRWPESLLPESAVYALVANLVVVP